MTLKWLTSFKSQTDHTWRSWRTLCICCRHTGSHFLSWCNVMPSTYFPSQNVATGIEIYIFKHLKWCFGWFSGFFKVYIRPRLFSRHSHITECTECVCVCVIAGSPWRPYGFIMQDTDLMHFTTAVNTFHKPEQREREKRKDGHTYNISHHVFLCRSYKRW